MSGIPEFNRPAFMSVAERITRLDYVALNPAILPDGLSQAEYMDICLSMLRCANAIYLLNGWESSLGAVAERALAEKLGLTIMLQGE